jgi:hypothetical protein
MTRAVHERLPIHLLFRQIEGGDVAGACGAEKDAVPALAAFQRGGPAIDGCLYGMVLSGDDKNCGEKRQYGACDDSLDDVCADSPMRLMSEQMKPHDAHDDFHGQGDADPSGVRLLQKGTLERLCFLI